MTQSMIEKVARAIYERDEAETAAYPQPWDDAGPWTKQHAFKVARAAIEAMREPTDAMVDAMAEHAGTIAPEYAYEAAIDAALNEEVSE